MRLVMSGWIVGIVMDQEIAIIVMGMVPAFQHGVMAATIVLTNVGFAMDQADANNVMEMGDIMKKERIK